MLFPLLRRHLRPYVREIALVVALQLTQTCATLYLPTLNAGIIDNGVARGDSDHVLRNGAVMLAVTLVQIVCSVAAVYYSARVSMGVGRDLRAVVFRKVQDLSVREVGQLGPSSLITRTTNDVQQIEMLVLMALTMVVIAPVTGIGGLVLALHQDVPTSLLLLAVLPVLAGTLALVIGRMGPVSRTVQRRIDAVSRVVREQISGVRVIRAYVQEERERARFAKANTDLATASLRLGRLSALMKPAVMLVMDGSSVAVLWFAGHRVDDGAMQAGSLLAFLHYLLQILQAVLIAAAAFMMAPRAVVCAQRITEVLGTEPGVRPPTAPISLRRGGGSLDIRGVEVRYPGADEPVLRAADLTARPGETVAVIGSTGAGKTTLLNLVPRLFDPDRGRVLVNGVDVRDVAPADLATVVGHVPQRPYLFSGTIASNLRYGNPAATDDDLWRALETAQARTFVEDLPQGLGTPIGQGGHTLSGGQRQRLSIARTLVARPDVYLFDDCFSALDHATDKALRAALADTLSDATVVIVAQRVSTIRDADRIVVLDEGSVVGVGTHTELMTAGGTYRARATVPRSLRTPPLPA
ncbi:ABC transporter ATP-binding protein [Streptomyces sp. TRM70350]|uniref:ABC transporter ATP-binding protein n=1 Tax=Streptomyces sp. TRM70350 TaxID=2856165 RepID=UPI001C467ED7|nr:ABC transporter ATP-binding protein [Streptomyces sp. TRM70350]MBV7697453.1 ABC transporter ATP-binding protein/permease [Streptomyces sp. TRM70350]